MKKREIFGGSRGKGDKATAKAANYDAFKVKI